MATSLQIWLARLPQGPERDALLRDLLGNVWKLLWNDLFPEQKRAETPEEARFVVLDWAERTPGFPASWKNWLVWSIQAPSKLQDVAQEIIAFCEKRDDAQAMLRTLRPPVFAPAAERFCDYRGVPCPLNSVRARLELARMEPGQQLRLLLDCGSPIENVPASLCADGHTITERTRKGDFWELLVTRGH